MTVNVQTRGSLKRRLVAQLLLAAAVLSLVLFLVVRAVALRVAEAAQDNILGASAIAIADELRPENEGIAIDIPYSSLSMLGTLSDDSVYYRVTANGLTITGYDDLPLAMADEQPEKPAFRTVEFRGSPVRTVSVLRVVTVDNHPVEVSVTVAQTQRGQTALIANISNTAAAVGVGFFCLAGVLSWLAANSALRPLVGVTEALQRRGPHDLRPLRTAPPRELAPLVYALNVFMQRLQSAMIRTEDFLTEAAHRVRTPLATVRTQTEIAIRMAESDDSRRALRSVIRAVDESSRSAGQLIDHAMVTFRSDHLKLQETDVAAVAENVIRSLTPTADLKDIGISFAVAASNTRITGDPVLLHGALRNLLDNAIKYSPDESAITVEVLNDAPEGVCVRICDEGRGIAGATQKQLAGRFSRGENVGDIVGSGLGLTIADDVAQIHHGKLVLEPNGEKGTCASLFLPLS
ncbi:MAG: sensor histidine kinase N-terminal domain-containing protein [Paracoccaceae bacterium]